MALHTCNAPHGFIRLRAGEVTRSGQVASATARSLECTACGRLVLDRAPLRSAHRRKHHAGVSA